MGKFYDKKAPIQSGGEDITFYDITFSFCSQIRCKKHWVNWNTQKNEDK